MLTKVRKKYCLFLALQHQYYFSNIMLMLHIRKNLSYLLPQME